MEFQPERYLKDGQLNPDVRDPGSAAFGFGRRLVDPTYCPPYMLINLQYMSWKILERQLVIFDYIMSSRGL